MRLPIEDRWTRDYQLRFNAQLEAQFDRLNQFALVPSGGGNGQVLSKRSERDFDVNWIDNTSGGGIDSLISRITTAEGNIVQLGAEASSERTLRIEGDVALAQTITSVSASFGTITGTIETNRLAALASVATEASARASADSALSSLITTLTATVSTNAANASASVSSEASARAAADAAQATAITTVQSQVTSIAADVDVANDNASDAVTAATAASAAVATEASTRATADSANASNITNVAANLTALSNSRNRTYLQTTAPAGTSHIAGDLWFDTDDSNKMYRWSGSAWVLIDDSRISANTASITTEQTARVDGDATLASSITTVSATASAKNRTFSQASAPTAQATGDIWFDTDDNNKSYRWNGSSWVATDDTRIATNAASISTEQSARIAADGSIEAKYGVKVDVNGYVTGFGLISTSNTAGPTSTFTVLADSFKIVTPGNTPTSPFQVVGGVTYIKEAQIQSLTIGKLSTGTLNADMNIGSGRIVYDNGSFMKVSGTGFGTSNQFIEWFGNRPSGGNIALCSEANATYYLKTNGAAYFGGALLAGVLRNGATSTDKSALASVEVGPFSTNGNNKVVVVSYSFFANKIQGTNPGSPADPTCTVKLYRTIGTAAETEVSELNVEGNVTVDQIDTNQWRVTTNMDGSTTFTDTNASLADRVYRATIFSRSTPSYTLAQINRQETGFVSTEQP